MKKVKSFLWQIKVRLQFTGWLQYMPPAALALLTLLLSAGFRALCYPIVSQLFLAIGLLALSNLIFELVTIKWGIRPREPRPPRLDQLNPFDLIRARHSCRSFQLRRLTEKDLSELMAAVERRTAEATIGSAPIRFDYINAPLTVWPVVGATEFFVAIAPKAYDRLAVIDIGRTLQKIVIDATRMGLGTCWIGPGADHASILHHLGQRFDPERDHIICVCAVGYESRYIPLTVRLMNRSMHRRRPLTELFFADAAFTQPLDVKSPPFDRFGRTYELCQWSPSSFNGQPTRCVAVIEPPATASLPPIPIRFDFYATTDSRFYAPVALGIWCANWEMGCQALGLGGHFAICPEPTNQATAVAHYDVSWLVDKPF